MNKITVALGLVALAAMNTASTCSIKNNGSSSSSSAGVAYTQIERLARPAINEGLIVTNAYLNAFNSIPPSADLSAAAAPVRAEAVATLNAVDMLDGVDNVDAGTIAGAFLPDVMRIDTSLAIPLGTPAYSAAANAFGALTGGRKIEDDVIDITLTVLVGAPVSDGVSYPGVAGNPAQPGHKKLNGQAAYNGAASFPFLASPN